MQLTPVRQATANQSSATHLHSEKFGEPLRCLPEIEEIVYNKNIS